MPTDRIVLIGAGGHATVVLDALMLSAARNRDIVLADDNPARHGQCVLGYRIEPLATADFSNARFHMCIGNNEVRARVAADLEKRGGAHISIVHPGASVSKNAELADGVFVAAHAVVAPLATVGAGVIVNHGAVIDHECLVEEFCHIAPGATLSGAVSLGARVLVGAGARLLPGVRVGMGASIGAGAVVRSDVPARAVYVGVPAKRVR